MGSAENVRVTHSGRTSRETPCSSLVDSRANPIAEPSERSTTSFEVGAVHSVPMGEFGTGGMVATPLVFENPSHQRTGMLVLLSHEEEPSRRRPWETCCKGSLEGSPKSGANCFGSEGRKGTMGRTHKGGTKQTCSSWRDGFAWQIERERIEPT